MLERLTTESHNLASTTIDQMSTLELVRLMNDEDMTVAAAVRTQIDPIAKAIDVIAERLANEGRLIYIGAGTSGRLGVLDASECPPTFRSPPQQVVGLIAGGSEALTRAIEGAEDRIELAREDLQRIDVNRLDVVVGIATSGRTPYVREGLRWARQLGCATVGISCNEANQLSDVADLMIVPVVGPEVISGSTRLKAGTATKMVLNMLSTGAMVRLGKTYGNLMVDLRATNQKLQTRSLNILKALTDADDESCLALLDKCQGEVKTSLVVYFLDVNPEEARRRLRDVDGHLHRLIGPRSNRHVAPPADENAP